jgi:putative membrane protein
MQRPRSEALIYFASKKQRDCERAGLGNILAQFPSDGGNIMLDLWLAIGHHLIIFALFGVLAVELVLVRRDMIPAVVARVTRVDAWYGVLAGAILVVGFSRAIFAAKGWAYYSHNGFFWAKIATFVLIAVLSVFPTIQYIKWQRSGQVPAPRVAHVRLFLYAELVLFAFLPIFAAAMARGYGEFR